MAVFTVATLPNRRIALDCPLIVIGDTGYSETRDLSGYTRVNRALMLRL